MENKKPYKDYFKLIKKYAQKKDKTDSEYTYRTSLENFLNEIKPKEFQIQQEPRGQEQGIPDFRVKNSSGITLGYIETKKLGSDLDKILNTNQIKNYLQGCNNLVLTDYAVFYFIFDGKSKSKDEKIKPDHTVTFYKPGYKKPDETSTAVLNECFNSFFGQEFEKINKPERLAEELAEKTRLLKHGLKEQIKNHPEERFTKRLLGIFSTFKDALIDDLEEDEFLDVFSQTITYGLFLVSLDSETGIVSVKDASISFPSSIEVVQRLFRLFVEFELPSFVKFIVDGIIDILNNTDKRELIKGLSFEKPLTGADLEEDEDPYVYFYENFLKAYDPDIKKLKGVYYTPMPVVRFIVRSVDEILKSEFGKSGGLAEPGVTVLDFASGTGTFLLESFKTALGNVERGLRSKIIAEVLLRSYYGFEYLITPYIISHLKLSKFLEEKGYEIGDTESDRLQIYLTDTLDNTKHKDDFSYPILTDEGKAANKVKLDDPIMVIMGNPPYNRDSKNNKEFAKTILEEYKEGLENEKNIKPLNDDYIKFIRFAQCKINGFKQDDIEIKGAGKGIIGIITNNSFLNGRVHREMRKSLLSTFDRIYIIDLHGNYRKGEKDQNVFDIQVGVAITLFIKTKKPLIKKEIKYFSTQENNIISRDKKYDLLNKSSLNDLDWIDINPLQPFYLFISRKTTKETLDLYHSFVNLKNIFLLYNSGFKTGRDKLTIQFNEEELRRIKSNFLTKDENSVRSQYGLKDSRDWKYEYALNDLKTNPQVLEVDYRLFDRRFTYYSEKSKGFSSYPRYNLMQHLLHENFALNVTKICSSKEWLHVFLASKPFDSTYLSAKTSEICYGFPLYLYKEKKAQKMSKHSLVDDQPKYIKIPNLKNDFLQYIEALYPNESPTPENIIRYIYAVLHSPKYREKFNEFLKIDFPKIPFTKNYSTFLKLADLGKNLTNLHLMNNFNFSNVLNPEFKSLSKKENLNLTIESSYPKYNSKKEILLINNDTYIANVPKIVYNFTIGGYKVLDKYIKYRKNKELSFKETQHIKKIIKILMETHIIMKQIDDVNFLNEV